MKFSIITCTYNSERYLQKNIDSIKNQTFRDFEHIFIDGFSTDKTMEIIEKYRQEFPEKVKVFQFPAKGIGNAMNEGIKKSSGEYLIHLHSDDSLFSNSILEKVSEFIKKYKNPNWIYGKAKFINEKAKDILVVPHRKIYQKARFWLLLMTNYIPHQSVFIKKEIFEKFGNFNEYYKNSMDYEMWLRFTKNKIPSTFINEIICNFSVRDDSLSSQNKNNCKNENILIIKKYANNKIIQHILSIIIRINFLRNFF